MDGGTREFDTEVYGFAISASNSHSVLIPLSQNLTFQFGVSICLQCKAFYKIATLPR